MALSSQGRRNCCLPTWLLQSIVNFVDSACVDRLGAFVKDRLRAFVTDRLALREEARRYWLRVLWGLAAVVSLLALATLGYIVLSAR